MTWSLVLVFGLESLFGTYVRAENTPFETFSGTSTDDVAPIFDDELLSPANEAQAADFLKAVQGLEQAFLGKIHFHPLDQYRLIPQTVLEKPRDGMDGIRIKKSNVEIRLVKKKLDSGGADDSVEDPNTYLELWADGKAFHRFEFPILDARRVNDTIVVLEPGTYHEETGVQNYQIVDLEAYEALLGRDPVPVFRVPVKTGSAQSSIAPMADGIQAGAVPVPGRVLHTFSEVQQTGFNMAASLADPALYESAGPLVDQFSEYFDTAVDLQGADMREQMASVMGNADAVLDMRDQLNAQIRYRKDLGHLEKLPKAAKRLRVAGEQSEISLGETRPDVKVFLDRYNEQTKSAELFKRVSGNTRIQRKLLARTGWVIARLATPSIKGVRSLLSAMGECASITSEQVVKPALKAAFSKRGIRAVALFGGTLWAWHALDPAGAEASGRLYAEFFGGILESTRVATETLFGSLFHWPVSRLAGHAAEGTFAGVNPVTFYEAYLSPERWPKFAIGFQAIASTIFVALGVPHLVVNAVKLAKELPRVRVEGDEEKGFLGRWVGRFVERQNREKQKLYELLGRQRGDSDESVENPYSAAEDEQARAIVDDLRLHERKGALSRMTESIRSWKIFSKFRSKPGEKMTRFHQALIHFLVGYSSFTNSVRGYVQFWQRLFAFRSVIATPRGWASWPMILTYPDFLETVIKRAEAGHPRATLPTEINGGLRTWSEKVRLGLGSAWAHVFGKTSQEVQTTLAKYEEWENKVLGAEQLIIEACIERALREVMHDINDHEVLQELLRAKKGFQLTPAALEGLSVETRKQFRVTFERLYKAAFDEWFRRNLGSLAETGYAVTVVEDEDLKGLKELFVEAGVVPELSRSEAAALLEDVATEELLRSARETSRETFATEHLKQRLKYRALQGLDPLRNPQMSRIASVARQLRNPAAVARAVRATIASNLVDKPMELMFTFMLTAGITEGLLQPIQDEMFGPNSWFHLSRFVFTNGFIYGVITGVLADAWMKLQQDELHEGQFDSVPEGDDAKLSFAKYWYKRTFHNPENKLWQNQRHFIKIIWANMPAALVMILAENFLTLNRFDLDSYFTGYLLAYVLPTSGFAFMLEQGFELSTGWFLRNVPTRFRSHPLVQEHLNKKAGGARIRFNLYYKMYENMLGSFLQNLSQMTTPELGSRSFSRLLLFGYTPTELASRMLHATKDGLGFIPGVETFTSACDRMLTTNYTDFQKWKPPPPPPGGG